MKAFVPLQMARFQPSRCIHRERSDDFSPEETIFFREDLVNDQGPGVKFEAVSTLGEPESVE